MAEHRQAERRLGDEDIARHLHDGQAGRLSRHDVKGEKRLVVAPRRDPETGEIYGVTTHLRPAAD